MVCYERYKYSGMNIPNFLRHIWIGPNPAPKKWMKTWVIKHPHWQYEIFDDFKLSNKKFYNQQLIETFYEKGIYAGAADLIRYELLYENGGFIPEADSICLENTDELWTEDFDYCYSVYEHETFRPGFISPIYASNPKNKFLELIINDLHNFPLSKINKRAWTITGNQYLEKMVREHTPKIKIFPSHYFIPKHFKAPGPRYNGPDKIYADQFWGTTRDTYNQGL